MYFSTDISEFDLTFPDNPYEYSFRDYIGLNHLLERWKGKYIDGIPLNFTFVNWLVRNKKLQAYGVISFTVDHGKKIPIGYLVNSLRKGDVPFGGILYFFSNYQIQRFEQENMNIIPAEDPDSQSPQERSLYLEEKLKQLEEYIEELQGEITTLEECTIPELQAKIAELKAQQRYQPTGLPKLVMDMRMGGKTEQEIAICLQEFGLPRKAIGALMRQEDSPIKDYGQWLDEQKWWKRE